MAHPFLRIGTALLIAGLAMGCSAAPAPDGPEEPAARAETIAGSDFRRLTLSERAAQRLGIETAPVESVAGPGSLTAVPYAAIFYAPGGVTWVYASPQPLTFVREIVVVERIDGGTAVLSAGPTVGSQVVTVGVAELYGAEFEVGQ